MISRRCTRPLLALALLCAHCSKHPAPPPAAAAPAKDGLSLSEESLHYLRIEPAAPPPKTSTRSLFARVAFDEARVVSLGTPVSGRVTQVAVTTGAPVKKGQALVTIRSSDLAAASAQLLEAKHESLLAQQVAARSALLVTQGAGSEAEAQAAETAQKIAKDEERRAQEQMAALGASGDGTSYVIRSPIAGTVTERAVNVGNAVGGDVGAALVTVADLSVIWIIVDVFERDLPYVAIGNQARIEIPALRQRAYEGKVSYVGSVVDPDTRTTRARIELTNDDRALRPGMFAEVQVQSSEVAAALVPTSAVLARRDEFFVFVQNDQNRFVSRKVEVGEEQHGAMTILSGLRPGEKVVARGAILLDAEANAAF